MTKKVVTVYQMKVEMARELGYRSLASVYKDKEGRMDMTVYKVVFGEKRVDNVAMWLGECDTDIQLLEYFYRLTNDPSMQSSREVLVDHFKYNGHSISVGDVMKINDTFYYCDSIGWKEIKVKNVPHWITVGMGASGTYFSDFTPYEVIKVSPSGKTVTLREMDWKVISGSEQNGSAEYEYSSNVNGEVITARVHKHEGWKTPSGMKIYFGRARRYYDPTF